MVRREERMYISVVKGVLIFLMLWGHCIQYCAADSFDFFGDPVFKGIYSFHMPLFMLVSGYLFYFSFQKRNLKELLVHRTQAMLQPIVFASILNSFLSKIAFLAVHGSIYLWNGELLFGINSLWFLWCVLASSVAVAISCKITQNLCLQLLGIVAGIAFVALFPNLHMQLYMYPYFVIGFFFAKYKNHIPGIMKKLAWGVSIVLFPLLLLFYENKHYIYITPIYQSGMAWSDVIWINGFRWLIGLVGSVFVLGVIWVIYNGVVTGKRISRSMVAIAKLGENSLSIYCLSVSLLSTYLPIVYGWLLAHTGSNIFAENMLVYRFLFTPLLTALYCLGLYGCVVALKKSKLHGVIFGR